MNDDKLDCIHFNLKNIIGKRKKCQR